MLQVVPPTVVNGLAVWAEPDRDRLIMRTRGEIDLATIDMLDDGLQEAIRSGFDVVVWDMRAITFMGADGVKVALRAQRGASDRGIRLELVNASAAVRHVFDLLRRGDRLRSRS